MCEDSRVQPDRSGRTGGGVAAAASASAGGSCLATGVACREAAGDGAALEGVGNEGVFLANGSCCCFGAGFAFGVFGSAGLGALESVSFGRLADGNGASPTGVVKGDIYMLQELKVS